MTIVWKWGEILSSGFTSEFQEGFVELTMDAGTPMKREKWTDVMDIIKGSFTLDRQQYIDFKSWYKHNIRQGTIPFQYYDARYDVYRTARLIGKPQESSNSIFFNISCTIAFDSNIIYQERVLTANPDKTLVANGDKVLVYNKKLRI